MTIDAIKEAVRAEPFHPFKLRLAGGPAIVVAHPDYIALGPKGRTVVAEKTIMTELSSDQQPTEGPSSDGAFVNTRWSLIAAARRAGSAESAQALEILCRSYWYPLYVFVRRKGYSPEDAEDLTQAFFAHLLERHFTERVDRDKGRFRSFLLTSLNYFLANHRAAERAQKRGGGKAVLSLHEILVRG